MPAMITPEMAKTELTTSSTRKMAILAGLHDWMIPKAVRNASIRAAVAEKTSAVVPDLERSFGEVCIQPYVVNFRALVIRPFAFPA